MRNLIQLIIRHYFFLLFLLLESLSFSLLIRYNHFQRASFTGFTSSVQGYLYDKFGGVRDYFNLRKVNEDLVNENTLLKNQMDRLQQLTWQTQESTIVPPGNRQFLFYQARVLNNSVNKEFNYITVDKGSLHHIKPEMAVTSPEGVVGIVFSVSRRFSVIMPILNRNFGLSAKIKKNNYFGSLTWPGESAEEAILTDIPYHVMLEIGDTIITSGYSAIFPEGLYIGTISDFNRLEGNFYRIKVDLAVNFRNLEYVYLIDNLLHEEQVTLEDSTDND
jgi:rod shape-determining protein MreC